MARIEQQGKMAAIAAGLGLTVVTAAWTLEAVSVVGSPSGMQWLIARLPVLPYLVALAGMVRAAMQVARGNVFGRIMPRILRLSGLMLTLGAVLQMFVVPLLFRLTDPSLYKAIGHYDPAYLAVGAVGVLLWMFAGMMEQALAMANELEEFF